MIVSRLAMVHTSATLVPIFGSLCQRRLPHVETFNLVDDSLVRGIRDAGEITPPLRRRVASYLESAELAGATHILVTCSSIGPAVEAAASLVSVPVLRVDRPMADEAVRRGDRIGVVATLKTTLEPTAELIHRRALAAGRNVQLTSRVCDGAFEALMAGNPGAHDEAVQQTLRDVAQESDVIVLAQASMARVADNQLQDTRDVPILSSPTLAIEHLSSVL